MANKNQKYIQEKKNSDYENDKYQNDYNYIDENAVAKTNGTQNPIIKSIHEIKIKNEKALRLASEQANTNKKVLIALVILLIISICIGVSALAIVITQKSTLSEMNIS